MPNMEDALNEILFDAKPVKRKVKTEKVKLKETNLEELMDRGNSSDPAGSSDPSITDPSDETSPQQGSEDKDGADTTDEKAADTIKEGGKMVHKAKGQVVMSVALTISDKDMGKCEIGKDEFVNFADVTSLLDLYGVNADKLKTVDAMPTSFNLAIKDEITSDKNSIMLVYRLNDNSTITTTLYVGSDEVPLDAHAQNIVETAFAEFDKQYKTAIRQPINQEIFG